LKHLLVLVFILLTLVLAPRSQTAAQSAPGASVFGINSHIASRYPDIDTVEQPAALVRQLGLGWVREDVQWARVEPQPGAYDWSWYDRVFAAHRSNGLNIIGVIMPAVGWATPEPGDAPDEISFFAPDPAQYAAFARAAAERYRGQVQAWEIWNEPDDAQFWRPAPDPPAYARLLTAASAAIKSVDPGVVVLNGGVVPFDTGFLESLAVNGAWSAIDALSVHPYVDPYTPEGAQIDAVGIANVRTLAARLGSKPIWATEFGWGSGACERDPAGRTDENAQANYLARAGVLLRAAGAERVLWYNFKDRDQPCYGIVRGSGGLTDYGSLKPAAAALATLSRQLGSASPRGAPELMPGATVLSFDDAAGWGGTVPAGNAPIAASGEQVFSGTAAGKISYRFAGADNEYIAFLRSAPTPLPAGSTRLGLWVYGDGSGHMLQVQLEDAEGEVLQYRLGFIGTPGWQRMTASLSGEVAPGNRITGGDGRLTEPVRVRALVVDDYPNPQAGTGTIWVDELAAATGAEIYAQRFDAGNQVVDVVWSLGGGQARIPSASAEASVIGRDGAAQTIAASGGALTVAVGEAPIYVRHVPGTAVVPPAPVEGNVPDAAAFERVWASTDRAVRDGQTSRSWLWGPAPIQTTTEPYAQAPGGSRLVRYYDKARMEINDPAADPAGLFYVTNGLLPIELSTGKLKIGDGAQQVERREPADVPLAGDPAAQNPGAPTYRTLGAVATTDVDEAPRRAEPAIGRAVTATLARDGSVGDDVSLSRYGVAVGSYSNELGHNVADVFDSYLQSLPLPAVFVMGLPISEPYWTRARVGGVERDVLVQAWERRVLTYTPDNEAAFRIEMGNVGRHYWEWRYGSSQN